MILLIGEYIYKKKEKPKPSKQANKFLIYNQFQNSDKRMMVTRSRGGWETGTKRRVVAGGVWKLEL